MTQPTAHSIVVHQTHADGLPTVTGCPFLVGAKAPAAAYAEAVSADGARVPVQCAALTQPDRRGVQWLELSLLATVRGEARVVLGGSPPGPEIARRAGETVILEHEGLRVRLSADPADCPLRIERLDARAKPSLTGRLAPEWVDQHDALHTDTGAAARELRVIRNGALRAQAELAGRMSDPQGTASLDYRLTVELWRGVQAVRVNWMLLHQVAGCPELTVRRASLRGDWAVGDNAARHFIQTNHGDYYRRREVVNPDQVVLVADYTCGSVHVADPAMLLDDAHYARYLPTPTVQTAEWLALAGSSGSVAAGLLDFTESRPNALRSVRSELTYDLLPDGHSTAWPQGRRREQTLLLAPGPGTPALRAEDLAAEAGKLDVRGRAQPTAAALRATGVFDMELALRDEPGRHTRITRFLDAQCHLNTPADKWNLGDTIDSHYTRSYAPIPNRYEPKPGAPPLRPEWTVNGSLSSYFPAGCIEPVWTNNEYDIIHVLAQEAARSGRANHLRALRWFARHTIEVDFVAYSDDRWHHRAQPAHSAHHNTTGAYPSHFWTQGLLQYYLLSGDRDALEVAVALGDKTLEYLDEDDLSPLKFNREVGWGLLALVCLAEVTAEPRFAAGCTRIVDFLIAYDRAAFRGMINLSAGDASKCFDRQMVDCAFGYFSMVEAVDRYQKLSGREDVHAWLCELLVSLKHFAWERVEEGQPGGLVVAMMAVGYERTGNPDFLEVGMAGIDALFGPFGRADGSAGETKPNATSYRAVHRMLGHADRAGLLDAYEYPAVRRRRAQREGRTDEPDRPPRGGRQGA